MLRWMEIEVKRNGKRRPVVDQHKLMKAPLYIHGDGQQVARGTQWLKTSIHNTLGSLLDAMLTSGTGRPQKVMFIFI
jgi:hypothetical protein